MDECIINYFIKRREEVIIKFLKYIKIKIKRSYFAKRLYAPYSTGSL